MQLHREKESFLLEKVKTSNSLKGTVVSWMEQSVIQRFCTKTDCTTLFLQNNSNSVHIQYHSKINQQTFKNNSILVSIQEIENGNIHYIHPSEIETRIDEKSHFQKPLNYILMCEVLSFVFLKSCSFLNSEISNIKLKTSHFIKRNLVRKSFPFQNFQQLLDEHEMKEFAVKNFRNLDYQDF
jgi:hypothetical protein